LWADSPGNGSAQGIGIGFMGWHIHYHFTIIKDDCPVRDHEDLI
jgi:hypothetical protein